MTNENRNHCCCFFGHRKIIATSKLKKTVYKTVENLIINKEVDTFLFGSKSQFDNLCLEIVTELKKKYKHIKRIYVRAEFPYINDNYKEYLLKRYDDTYFPQKIICAGKASYIERNYEMINKSHFCIVYYNEKYLPSPRKHSNRDLITYQPQSGTKLALTYAEKQGLYIENVFM